jgi:multidrug resistance efflux pump
MELDEVKDAYRQLESNLSRDDQQYKQQAQKLQKNLDQMNAMYQQVIQEKSTMKIDLSLAEKKAMRKDERIVLLEKTLVKEKENVRYSLVLI